MPRLGLGSSLTGGAALVEDTVLENTYSVSFDGSDDHMEVSSTSFELDVFSISAWVRYNGTHASNWASVISVGHLDSGYGWVLGTSNSATNIGLWALSSGTGWGHTGAISMTVDAWTHIVATYDGSTVSVYKDAATPVTASRSGTITYTGISKLYIGEDGAGGRNINANIDEVSFWNKALDSSEVTDIYNDGVPTDLSGESGLVAYWRFETGSGTSCADSSDNSNTGTLVNSPTWDTDVPS